MIVYIPSLLLIIVLPADFMQSGIRLVSTNMLYSVLFVCLFFECFLSHDFQFTYLTSLNI